ncbi:MAG: hypothetical protein WC044_13065 [Crocinitomicaceae bacterium]
MNKISTVVLLLLLSISCNKVKQKNKQMAGDWQIVTYGEIIFDGTLNKYTLNSGNIHFDNLNDHSDANFQLDFSAYSDFDTVEYHLNGTYSRQAIDSVTLKVGNEAYLFNVERQFKTDMNFQGGFVPKRKSVFILKKK